MLLDELDHEFSATQPSDLPADPQATSTEAQAEIAALRFKLLRLISIEDSLASELSGGVSISGGRTGAFVRAGWQALVTSGPSRPDARSPGRPSEASNLAARTLSDTRSEIQALWQHPSVRQILELRKLRLDDSAPL